jgi:hypothetical protein
MEDVKKQIAKIFYEAFTAEKIRKDFHSYLKECFSNNDGQFSIPIYIEDKEDSVENILITFDDELTKILYKCVYEFDIDMYFEIIVAVGNYIESNHSGGKWFFEGEKCLAKLRYNYDLELFDIEFSIPNWRKS